MARQSVKLGGMGLRSLAEQCRLAFYSMQKQALPQFYRGFCTLLEPVVGGAYVFGEASSGDHDHGHGEDDDDDDNNDGYGVFSSSERFFCRNLVFEAAL